ncbi:thiamine phosphate synthase [Schlesneria sp. DSM 10557]|uniref:thiamine phosphate synthase n=2 Tax=unclassified Schlesneria TaxID=2762017 RepID=UPI0035A196C2
MTDVRLDVFRILDASANRAREGLRVIEDFARFMQNDETLSRRLKQHRHELTGILSELPTSALLSARDTVNDVGTTISVATEYQRTSADDVVQAAFKRVQEALRSLEEFSKVVDAKLAARFEQLRYQLYTTEKVHGTDQDARQRLDDQRVYLLITAAACDGGPEAVVKAALDGGVRLIQSREKSLSDREWLQLARQLRAWTAAVGALLVINDRPDLAVLCDADGVHVGQEEFTVAEARTIVGPERLVGVSTHSVEQARQAVLEGADYLGVGPTFPSTTKSFSDFPGLTLVREVSKEVSIPWFAIGGIGTGNVATVVGAGARRVAVSSAICSAPSPMAAARALIEATESNCERPTRTTPQP